MFRIDGAGNVEGAFVGEDAATNRPPTEVTPEWLNMLQNEGSNLVAAAGLVLDKNDSWQLAKAVAIAVRLQSAAYAVAGGTADALTGTYAPVVPALVNGLTLYVRAASANTTTTPNFSPNGLAAKQIVKGNSLPLVAGDIAGAGHWIELQYDLTLDKWVLLNPATGTVTVTTTTDPSFADSSEKPASTGWIRNSMSAIAIAAGFSASFTPNGYVKFPIWLGGVIFQWMGGWSNSAGISNTLPIAFTISNFMSIGGILNSAGVFMTGCIPTSKTVTTAYSSSSASSATIIFAIGK